MGTYNKTLFLNIPEGYEVKYQIVKIKVKPEKPFIKPLNPDEPIVEDDDCDMTKIVSRRPKYLANYNRNYYLKKKAERIEALQIKSKLIDL
jgi:hypothetical protein